MTPLKRLIAASFVTCLIGLPCYAQDQRSEETFIGQSPVVGSWSFKTTPYRQGTCKMSGNMNISPTERANMFTCSFTATEECKGQDKWVVEQTCKAVNQDGQLSIKSSIVNFLDGKEYTASYVPDHFALNIISRELMSGSLVSAVSAPVEFRRDADNVS